MTAPESLGPSSQAAAGLASRRAMPCPADQPLMEVARPLTSSMQQPGSSELIVTSGIQPSSECIARFPPGSRLKLLSTCKLQDGTRRASIATEDGIDALGWVTTAASDGTKRVHRFGRPVYEIPSGSTLKLRKQVDIGSKYITRLAAGTRLHIVDVKKTSEGATRVAVVVLNHPKYSNEKTLGWITAMKTEDESPALREVVGDDALVPAAALQTCSPSYGISLADRAFAARASNPLEPKMRNKSPERSGSPVKDGFFGTAVPQALIYWAKIRNAVHEGSLTRSLAATDGVKPAIESPKARTIDRPTARSPKYRPAHAQPSRKKSSRRAASVATDQLPAVHHGQSQEASPNPKGFSKAKAQSQEVQLSSTELVATMNQCLDAALAEDAKSSKTNFRTLTLPVRLGEALLAQAASDTSGKWVDDLVRDWDPNRDGVVSKMEFRQNVHRMLPTEHDLVGKEIDALFDKLDLDHSGKLEVEELRKALASLQRMAVDAEQSAKRVARSSEMQRKQATKCQAVIDVTLEYENAQIALNAAERVSAASQLGVVLKAKGFKVADLLHKWGGKSGCVSRGQFKQEVTGMGIDAREEELDALFDKLDTDAGGTLDLDELKESLRILVDESTNARATIKQLKADMVEKSALAHEVQSRWEEEWQLELKLAEEAADEAAAEERYTAAAEAEAKDRRRIAAEARNATAAAEKAALEARIAAKRGK